jgi:hypothetical protein
LSSEFAFWANLHSRVELCNQHEIVWVRS